MILGVFVVNYLIYNDAQKFKELLKKDINGNQGERLHTFYSRDKAKYIAKQI
jgi:hypothetical protein